MSSLVGLCRLQERALPWRSLEGEIAGFAGGFQWGLTAVSPRATLRGAQSCWPAERRARQQYFFPRVYILGWVSLAVLPSLALGVKVVPAFFPGLLFAKVVARENFQIASRNVTREPQSFVKRVALKRVRHPLPPWAAAGSRPGSQPSLRFHRQEQGARGGRGEDRPTPRPGNSLETKMCSRQCMCCSGVGCVSTGEERITLISVSKSRA